MKLLRSALFILPIALGASASAEEWPRLRGPRGDGVVQGEKITANWPKTGPRAAWSAPVGTGYASPVADGGTLYVFARDANKEVLTAFAADTGKILWREGYEGGWDGNYNGTRATPIVDGDRVYTFGGAGDLIARERATGKQVYRTNVLQVASASNLQWGTSSNPLISGDIIYVQGGKDGPVAIALSKIDGKPLWLAQPRGNAGYASPLLVDVAGKAQLIVFAADTLYGLDPKNGNQLWAESWKTDWGVNAATPIYRDGLLFISSAYRRGSLMLRVFADKVEKVWQNRDVATRFNGAILDGDTLYANSEGELVAVDWKTGKARWSAKKGDYSLGMGGSLVRAGDKIIALGERGDVSLIKATPAAAEKLAQIDLLEGSENWATPLVYRGRLYLKGETKLFAYDLPAQ